MTKSKMKVSASYLGAATGKFLAEKETIRDLGKIAKDIGINHQHDDEDKQAPYMIQHNDK